MTYKSAKLLRQMVKCKEEVYLKENILHVYSGGNLGVISVGVCEPVF